MQRGPEASTQQQEILLDFYGTPENALLFFSSDNIDKSHFSLTQLLRVASKNTLLARALLSLQQSCPHRNYLSAEGLAILGENEEVAHAILDDNEIENSLYDRLLGKTFHRNAQGKIRDIKAREVKYLMRIASHHQSVLDRILEAKFLHVLEREQLVECAKAVEPLATHIASNCTLYEKMTRENKIEIAEVNEVFARWILHDEKDLKGVELERLSKASGE